MKHAKCSACILILIFFSQLCLASSFFNWQYRTLVNLDNTTNTSGLTDFQVQLELNTAALISQGKMKSDCGDIRFYDPDAATGLNYWIESGVNTGSTKIWIRVPFIPAGAIKTIALYYGNPTASGISDGSQTFLFFDDFEGSGIDPAVWMTATAYGYIGCGGYSDIGTDPANPLNHALNCQAANITRDTGIVTYEEFPRPRIIEAQMMTLNACEHGWDAPSINGIFGHGYDVYQPRIGWIINAQIPSEPSGDII